MGKAIKSKFIFLLLFVFIASDSLADNKQQEASGLFLSPENCYQIKNQQSCHIELKINWKTTVIGDYCLYAERQKEPLNCWENAAFGTWFLVLELENNALFRLTSKADNRILFTAKLPLFKKITRYRNKRRNPWSFY